MSETNEWSYQILRLRLQSGNKDSALFLNPGHFQEITVKVQREGPTHIITFDDKDVSDENVDVLDSLMTLREQAWDVDMALRKYQDEKGILVDVLLQREQATDPSTSIETDVPEIDDPSGESKSQDPYAKHSPVISDIPRYTVSLQDPRQRPDDEVQADNSGSKRWIQKVNRASSMASSKNHTIRSRKNTLQAASIPLILKTSAEAVAESTSSMQRQKRSESSKDDGASSTLSHTPDMCCDAATTDTKKWLKIMDQIPPTWEHQPYSHQVGSFRRVNFNLTRQPDRARDQLDGGTSQHNHSTTDVDKTPLHSVLARESASMSTAVCP